MKVKPKRTLNWYFENRLFYLYLTISIILLSVNNISNSNVIGYDRTFSIGYGILGEFKYWSLIYSHYIYFFGLLLLLVLKKKTNHILSKLFIALVLIALIIEFLPLKYLIEYLKPLTTVIFIVLFIWSLFSKRVIKG